MGQYIKRIEAIKYTGDNYDEVKEFLGDAFYGNAITFYDEGIISAITPGHYIIKHKNGDFYKVDSKYFEEEYESCSCFECKED